MNIYVSDYRFDRVREELNENGEMLEIVPVKDAFDRIHAKVNDIYEAVVNRYHNDAVISCYDIDAEDIADLILCAMHLQRLGNIDMQDVDNKISEDIANGYKDPKPTAPERQRQPKEQEGCREDRPNEAATMLFRMIFAGLDKLEKEKRERNGGETK
jgi:hypothetical protein